MGTIHMNRADFGGNVQRQRVEQALHPRAMRPLLQVALGAPNVPLSCRVLDVKYEPGEYCTVLYQLGARSVIGTMSWGGSDEAMPRTDREIPALGMRVCSVEHDPALPGLEIVRDPRALAVTLSTALSEHLGAASRVLRCRATVLRHRPGRRCTFRVDAWLRDVRSGETREQTLFGKLYHTSKKAAPAYREMLLLADSSAVRAGRLLLARPVAYLPDSLMVLQEPVSGSPLDLLIGRMTGSATAGDPRGWDGIARAAAALAELHAGGLVAGRERPIRSEVTRFGERAARIARVDAGLGARMNELVLGLQPGLARLPEWGAELTLVHGDCKPSQFLIGADGVAILDFDHSGMSDPANDVGTFLATLRQLSIRQSLRARGDPAAQARSRWLRELENRFLEAYVVASGCGEGMRSRATWYLAAALMRKALRGFARAPHSPLPLAEVEEAWRVLETLPARAPSAIGDQPAAATSDGPKPARAEFDLRMSPVVQRELPTLSSAFDREAMCGRLQSALFGSAPGRHVVEQCAPGKAIYMRDHCVLRYRLEVKDTLSGHVSLRIVGARVFQDPLVCAVYLRDRLAPLAALMRNREELTPFSVPIALIEPLQMVVYVFPIDGELPSLVVATDRGRMIEIFNQILPEARTGRFIARDCRVVLINYARRSRCVMRYEITGTAPGSNQPVGHVVYGKVTTDGEGALIGPGLAALGAHLSTSGSACSFSVPRALGFRADLGLALLEAVPGEPRINVMLKARMSGAEEPPCGVQTLEEAIASCGRIASSLHTSSITLGPQRTLDGELTALRRQIEEVERVAPVLGARFRSWWARIRDLAEQSDVLQPCFSHGDFTSAQVVSDGARNVLVDFDTLCQAEPALDLGQFLAYLRVAAKKARRAAASPPNPIEERLGAQFLKAYVAASGDRLGSEGRLRARISVYKIVSLIRMALHSWQQIKPARLENVVAVLEDEVAQFSEFR